MGGWKKEQRKKRGVGEGKIKNKKFTANPKLTTELFKRLSCFTVRLSSSLCLVQKFILKKSVISGFVCLHMFLSDVQSSASRPESTSQCD